MFTQSLEQIEGDQSKYLALARATHRSNLKIERLIGGIGEFGMDLGLRSVHPASGAPRKSFGKLTPRLKNIVIIIINISTTFKAKQKG